MQRSHVTITGLAAAAVGGLLSIAACGGPASGNAAPAASGQPSQMASMPTMAAMKPSGSNVMGSAAAVTTNQIAIKNFAFSPTMVQVKVGTTVTWINEDQDAHTVTGTAAGGPLHSPTLQHGASYQVTFTKAGRYDYLCTIHPFMTATVVVS